MFPVWYQVLRDSIAVSERALEKRVSVQLLNPATGCTFSCLLMSSDFARDSEFLSLQVNEI